MSRTKKIIFTISILLNLFFLSGIFFQLNTDQLGILTKEVTIGEFFNRDSVYLKLPKGLRVRNISPQFISAIGQFEPYRFYIVVSSNDENLVNYNLNKDTLVREYRDNIYSMENIGHK